MYELEYTGQFKKDFKRICKQGLDLQSLQTVLNYLVEEGQVPNSFKPHVLSGKLSGIWECHIKPDWLLLYEPAETIKIVRLIRTGSHSELFKK